MCGIHWVVIIVWIKFVFDIINCKEHDEMRMLKLTSNSLIRATYLEAKHKNPFEKSRKLLLIFTWHVISIREALFTCHNFVLDDVTVLVLGHVHKYCTVTNRSIIVILKTLTVLQLNNVFLPFYGIQQFFLVVKYLPLVLLGSRTNFPQTQVL
jgi:hypothetical protein